MTLRSCALMLTLFSSLFASAQKRNVSDFAPTDGKIEKAAGGRLHVRSKELRAVLKAKTSSNITVQFTYLGPTQEVSRLGDGSVRHQFGLKLRAKDICNLVYVMWHFDSPNDNRIEVSVKSNPGKATHEQCRDDGYIFKLNPTTTAPAPMVRPDEPHTLETLFVDKQLTVKADGSVVWQGILPDVAFLSDGPAGLRSDNAHVVF